MIFKTKIAAFPALFETEFRFLIPCVRHVTRNHTVVKSIANHKTIHSLIVSITNFGIKKVFLELILSENVRSANPRF